MHSHESPSFNKDQFIACLVLFVAPPSPHIPPQTGLFLSKSQTFSFIVNISENVSLKNDSFLKQNCTIMITPKKLTVIP